MSKAEFTPHSQSLQSRRYSRMWARTFTLHVPSHATTNSIRHDIIRGIFHFKIFYIVLHTLRVEFNYVILEIPHSIRSSGRQGGYYSFTSDIPKEGKRVQSFDLIDGLERETSLKHTTVQKVGSHSRGRPEVPRSLSLTLLN